MKNFFAAALSLALLASPIVADDIPDNYAVSIFNSRSEYPEVDGLPIQAVLGAYRMGGLPTTICNPDHSGCGANYTALYNYTSLYINYFRGQQTFVDTENLWRYTQPMQAGGLAPPPGSTVDGFYFYPCPNTHEGFCYIPGYGRGGWVGCPPPEDDDDDRYIVYSNLLSDENVPTGSVDDCRSFEMVSTEIEEESYTYMYM